MPELPEVEEVRRSLEPHVLGKKITAVQILRQDFITPIKAPLQRMVGKAITRTHRHGKKMFLVCSNDSETLMVHLGMTGRVDCVPASAPLEKHTHVIFSLGNARQMRFVDPRRFGGIWFFQSLAAALTAETASLGKDALDIQPADLAIWKTMRGKLKHRLLSQHDVAGLGNIYVDEALWMTKLHPLQIVSRISVDQIKELVKAIHAVLRRSIQSGGTTLRDYRNAEYRAGEFAKKLQAYGRAGQPCLRCKTTLKSAVIATRTTVFCPTCQRRR